MGSPVEVKAACKTHPVAGTIYRYAVDGTSQSLPIPQEWKGNHVTVRPVGVAVQYSVSRGPSAQNIVINQTSAVGAPNAAAGATIVDGEIGDAIIGSADTFLNWRGATAGGNIEFFKSEKPVV